MSPLVSLTLFLEGSLDNGLEQEEHSQPCCSWSLQEISSPQWSFPPQSGLFRRQKREKTAEYNCRSGICLGNTMYNSRM